MTLWYDGASAATTTGSKDVVMQPFVHVTDNAVMNAYLYRNCYLNKVKHVIFFSCTTMYKSSKKPIRVYIYMSLHVFMTITTLCRNGGVSLTGYIYIINIKIT